MEKLVEPRHLALQNQAQMKAVGKAIQALRAEMAKLTHGQLALSDALETYGEKVRELDRRISALENKPRRGRPPKQQD